MILVDVGPAMEDLTPTVRHAISTFVTGKVRAQLVHLHAEGSPSRPFVL